MLKQTKEARILRRVQAVREGVAGHHINAVSATFHLTNAALRTWGQRFAQEGPQGLRDRPRPGRPRTVTCALAQHLTHLVAHDPSNTAQAPPSGSVAHSRPCEPPTLVSNSGVQVSAAFSKTGGELLSSHWAAGA